MGNNGFQAFAEKSEITFPWFKLNALKVSQARPSCSGAGDVSSGSRSLFGRSPLFQFGASNELWDREKPVTRKMTTVERPAASSGCSKVSVATPGLVIRGVDRIFKHLLALFVLRMVEILFMLSLCCRRFTPTYRRNSKGVEPTLRFYLQLDFRSGNSFSPSLMCKWSPSFRWPKPR